MAKFSLKVESEGGEGASSSSSSPRKRKRTEAEAEQPPQSVHHQSRGSDPGPDPLSNTKNTAISIDLDVLDCSICFQPLSPPVFQCENGHISCSSCCSKLNRKCHFCSWPISYRCLAIEKVIESVKISCPNSYYGCKENFGYTHKSSHEETCLYAPCACPISGCNFLGSSKQLSLHFCTKHWSSALRFRYNCPFSVAFGKSEPFIILQSEEGRLFLINNHTEEIGNVIALTTIGPCSTTGGFSYDLLTRNGSRSLRLRSFTKSVRERSEACPPTDFLLVPSGFHNCFEQLKMEICIWSSGEGLNNYYEPISLHLYP